MIRNTVTGLAVVAILAAGPAQAAASKEETIGIGTGGVLGAVAGGPIGFIVGAAIGAKLGDTLHQKDETIDSLAAEVSVSRSTITELELDLVALNRDIDAMNDELDHLKSVSHPELTRLLEAGIAMDLLFRTDEHALLPSTGDRFSALGSKLAGMDNVLIHLDGFADARGDAGYNLELSEKRVQFVREQLVAAGVAPARITTAAHGESPAADESADSLALERRVSLTLSLDNGPALAAMPE
jgi:outer membrane protein OmpA-like peptidoglycan-associated protein